MENPVRQAHKAGRKLQFVARRTIVPSRLRLRRRTPLGAAPGTLVADPEALKPVLRRMAYGPDALDDETVVSDPDDLRGEIGRRPVLWLNVDGLGDLEVLRSVAHLFGVHPLALEDVVNVYQRAKVEPYGDHLFVICRMFSLDNGHLHNEQLSLYVGPGFVVSFQEQSGDVFDPVRRRIRQEAGPIRGRGPGYLAYALVDAVVDAYFPVLETLGERLEDLEEEILSRPSPSTLHEIHAIRRDLLLMRRAAWPLREALASMLRDPLPTLGEELRVYLRDCYDHAIQVLDLIESYRELGANLADVYLSSISNRTNETMRVLTVIATLFIPLTFLAGIWGMNFSPEASPFNMPELHWRWGYPFALLVMLLTSVALLAFFRRKGWLGAGPRTFQVPDEETEKRSGDPSTGAETGPRPQDRDARSEDGRRG